MEAGLHTVDHKSHIDISDPLMLVVHLEDEENGCSPTELGGPSDAGGMNAPLAMSLHRQSREMRCMQRVCHMGQKRMSPQVESILALEGVLWDGALVSQLQKNAVKVKCGHLKEKQENYCKSKQHGIHGLICTGERCTNLLWMPQMITHGETHVVDSVLLEAHR